MWKTACSSHNANSIAASAKVIPYYYIIWCRINKFKCEKKSFFGRFQVSTIVNFPVLKTNFFWVQVTFSPLIMIWRQFCAHNKCTIWFFLKKKKKSGEIWVVAEQRFFVKCIEKITRKTKIVNIYTVCTQWEYDIGAFGCTTKSITCHKL